MDSEAVRDGHLMDLIDKTWCEDKLPMEDVPVPQIELPELESDNGNTNETIIEQEQRWTDLGLGNFQQQNQQGAN